MKVKEQQELRETVETCYVYASSKRHGDKFMYAESRKKNSASGDVKKSGLELSQSFDSSERF